MKILKNLGCRFNQIEELFISLLLLAMIFLASLQIFMRILFDSGLVWADPLLRHLVLWVGMLGAALATRYGKHITIDIFSHLLSARGALRLNLVLNFFAAVVCGFLTWAAFLFIKNEIAFGSGRELVGIPVWGWNLIFPFAFALMTVRFSAKIYEHGVTLLQPKSNSSRSISGSA
ncbi:MAG: TRAP transporter small permease [Pseudomonadota bacterium]|nr:TRAP transporter small permease [Pseudomonadota bacterium]